MRSPRVVETAGSANRVGRCFQCFRPLDACYCAEIPCIDNQTEVLILQHRRERFHRFNTARMVHKALCRSRLLVDHTARLAARLALSPRAALLYPSAGAEPLVNLPMDRLPEQLIVIDGTWHHTKTLLRDIKALHDVPRYRIDSPQPSSYRIRREPNAMFLSTVEATVAALRALEPQTRGLDHLLRAFGDMVDRQLAHPKSPSGWRRNAARTRGGRNIPQALLGNFDRLVVAYAESVACDRGRNAARVPVYLTAQRLSTGECFTSTIAPRVGMSDAILWHLQLTAQDFIHAPPFDEVVVRWQAFHRPDDILVVYNPSTARLLAPLASQPANFLALKSVDFNPLRRYSTLDDLVAGERLTVTPALQPGRAGRRLASLVALVAHLRSLKLGHTVSSTADV